MLDINYSICLEKGFSYGNSNFPFIILLYKTYTLFASKGTVPYVSKYKRIPKDHTSVLKSISPYPRITSGAKNAGVPPVSYIFYPGSFSDEIPKSHIFGLKFLSMRILSNLISQCIILLECKYSTLQTILRKKSYKGSSSINEFSLKY